MNIIDQYTIEGSDLGINGFDFKVKIEKDTYCTPDDADCYTPAQVRAWRNDEWEYVSVTVTPTRHGVTVHGAAQSLAGTEYGEFLLTDDMDNITGSKSIGRPELLEYPIKELAETAVAEARELISKL